MIDNMVIVAGPSCCGKTRFVSELRKGKLTSIEQRLELGKAESWRYIDTFYSSPDVVRELMESTVEVALVHWTVLHPSMKQRLRKVLLNQAYERKHRLDLIRIARRVTCLSLYADPTELIRRTLLRGDKISEFYENGRDSVFTYWRKRRHLAGLRSAYAHPTKLVEMYLGWFRFCANMGVDRSWLVNTTDAPELESQENWPNVVANWSRQYAAVSET